MVVDPTKKSDHARRLELHRLQSEFLILQQDYRKKSRKLEATTLELRRLNKEAARLKVATRETTAEEGRLKKEIGLLETDMKRVKKKINMMS